MKSPSIPTASELHAATRDSGKVRSPHALNFTAAEPRDFYFVWHAERATLIAGLFAVQVKAAAELGLMAAPLGIIENPFTERRLADAWQSGWVIGDDGAAP